MKLIVGLGNPGKEYEKTRHNAGFMFIDYFCLENKITFKSKMEADYAEMVMDEEKVIIMKPKTFMNNSGKAVKKYVDFYKIPAENILVIYDDTSFEVGKFKIKASGSSAGHKGIADIMNKLNTNEIKRVKIGITKNKFSLVDFVLSKFNKTETDTLLAMFEKNKTLINDFVKIDFDHLMSKYNIKGE